jgi:SacI restriction endonuclease
MPSHAEIGLELLIRAWAIQMASEVATPSELAGLVDTVFSGTETGYKKAIIIQAAGKAADPTLDAQSMQRGAGAAGFWDAREFAKHSFVKWNLAANQPFSHSADPYVSNPYRVPRFDMSQRSQRKKPIEFDAAVAVMERLNATSDAEFAFQNLVETLHGLRRWIADKDIAYPLPQRASLQAVTLATAEFLKSKSGGTRLQAIVAALVKSLAIAGFRISEVASAHVNSSDVAGQRAGDVSYTIDERVSAVEVKDRPLSRDELLASIDKARVASVTDLLFVVRSKNVLASGLSQDDLEQITAGQFSSGLNIYVEEFGNFSRLCLTLIGEAGRRVFLEEVGRSLSDQGADISHKWDWASIVKAL